MSKLNTVAGGDETERLGRAMALSAQNRPDFIGSALALWDRANPGRLAQAELCCDEGQLWRLAVTPRPNSDNLAQAAMSLGTSLGVNPLALVNILRFAESTEAFAGTNDDGEMLMAALDAGGEERDD
ncbi:hypothetical protein [Roseibium sp.]|uniref:hypothetical protein n=1 Tax=Roseibium sp. TaxID=1936156 RepID=UPI003A975732